MNRNMVRMPLLVQTRRKQQLWTRRLLLLKAKSTKLLMQLMVMSGIELMLLLSKVHMLELHLLREVQLKLLLGLEELHLEMLLLTTRTLLLLMRAEHRLAKSHQLLLTIRSWN